MTETRRAGDLINSQVTLLTYGGDEPLEIGKSAHRGFRGMIVAGYESVTHIEVPFTAWGYYSGSSYTRSNHRSLIRGYPDTFNEIRGDYGASYLALGIDQLIPVGLFDEMAELFEYPIYDEDDHSELEHEILIEDWESYLKRDVVSTLDDLGIDDDKLISILGEDYSDKLFEYFDQATWETNNYAHCEDAVSTYIPNLESEVIPHLVTVLLAL